LLREDGTTNLFPQEMKNLMNQQEIETSISLKTLHPFIEKEGLLRVGGNLQQSTLPYKKMHQMNLPSPHHFTQMFVSAEHRSLYYAGPLHLIPSLQV